MERRIVVDTELLCLLIAGVVNPRILGRRIHFKKFNKTHFETLQQILKGYDKMVVTPHALTELWYFISEETGHWDEDGRCMRESAREFVGSAIEVYHPAKDLVQRSEIGWLGLADVSQLSAALEGGFALTSADGPLCRQAQALGIQTHHFWQLAEG